ncbi:MAG: hypothetical protein LBV12_09200, partial [Puniceicoccales bacterium]|nr:hypothetical protein [Puniceicoccales bacterium]
NTATPRLRAAGATSSPCRSRERAPPPVSTLPARLLPEAHPRRSIPERRTQSDVSGTRSSSAPAEAKDKAFSVSAPLEPPPQMRRHAH